MTFAEQVIERIEVAGGVLAVTGDRIHCRVPENAAHLLDELREHKDEALLLLRKREEIPPCPAAPQLPSDPYQECLRAVLLQTARPEYPAGLIRWLENADPGLYAEITDRLPDLIHRLWACRAPLEEFQKVVNEWLAAHRRACHLFGERQGFLPLTCVNGLDQWKT